MDAQNQSVRTDEDGLRALKTDTSGQKVRLRFWEFDHFLTCPVVGTCLTAAEQKQLTKKAGLLKKKTNTFEIHETMVASSEDGKLLSVRIDNLLKRKLKRQARKAGMMSTSAQQR